MRISKLKKIFWMGIFLVVMSFPLSKIVIRNALSEQSSLGNSSTKNDIQTLKSSADQLRSEGSYQLAFQKYSELLQGSDISPNILREIKFKSADCAWRVNDPALLESAKHTLAELIDSKDHDQWWAQSAESLANLYLEKDRWSHPGEIKQYLEFARDFWAGETDLNKARARFIGVSFTLGDFVSQYWGWYYNGLTPIGASLVPGDSSSRGDPAGHATSLMSLYEEILRVATSDADKAKAVYSLAMSHMNQYSADATKPGQAEKYFKELISKYPKSEWADDAYYYLGQYYENRNDFSSALKTYQDLAAHFKKGESQWFDDASRRVEDISGPNLRVSVGANFLPDSEIQFSLGWRNLKEAQITFYKMDLVSLLAVNSQKAPTDSDYGYENYSAFLNNLVASKRYTTLPAALSFTKALKDEGKHLWYDENKGLAQWRTNDDDQEKIDVKKGVLPPGAYLLVATSGEKNAYELVMVTDMGLVTKVAGHLALIFTFDSKTGAPRPAVKVKYHYRYYDDQGHWNFEEGIGVTGADGVLKAALKASTNKNYANQHNLFACVSDGANQAFTQNNFYAYNNNAKGAYWLYAFSDRPAYRPNEKVSFKGILRGYDGTAFSTPSSMTVQARIYDPKGNQVKETSYTLNAFGSFSDAFTLDDKAPLGEYRVDLWSADWNHQIASAVLFRLEEYKLPEFKVEITPKPSAENKSSLASFRLGDKVDVELNAQYYFGAPVAGATVEYLIYQNPYYHAYYQPHPYEWYYAGPNVQNNYYGNNGQLVLKETATTDAHGKAVFSFQTPKDSATDVQYRIEARVVDQSRREIQAVANINVMKTSFLAYLSPKQNLYRPGDKAAIDIKTIDGNNRPQSVEGKVSVSRNWWKEPVVSEKNSMPAHYDESELFTRFVKTDKNGHASFEFQPEQEGFYAVKFTGFDTSGQEVISQTNVYVADKQSKDIGYRYGGLQIIAEKDTFSKGETARVMVVSDKPGTDVLLSAETDEIQWYQMIHLEGAVKLLEIPIQDTFVPNVFLSAVSAADYQLKTHELEFVVPPDDQFLNVRITSDKETYQPQEKGVFEIQVTDKSGNPVSAEVGLGVVDSSVFYIQNEIAPDIRQFFYGDKRPHNVQTQTSFYQRRYVRLVRDDDENLISEDDLKARRVGGISGDKYGNVNGPAVSLTGSVLLDIDNASLGKTTRDEIYSLETDFEGGRDRGDSFASKLEEKAMRKSMLASAAPEAVLVSGEGKLATPQVRSDFRSTVFWQPDVRTDASGHARVEVQFPDSLTTWRTTARAITQATAIGNITHEAQTKKDLIVRLQAPRFFVERDRTIISANVHNYTEQEQKIKVSLEAKGLKLNSEESVWVEVPSGDEKRVDWTTLAEQSGQAQLTVSAQTQKSSDAMTQSFSILEHGIEKFVARGVSLKNNVSQTQSAELSFDLPKERIKASTRLRLTLSPSLAASMLDALPFLADYPYGCVEQTMSRFLPAVIVAKTLKDLGISPRDTDDYIENALVPRNDPQGHPQRNDQASLSKLARMTKDGLTRLYDFQHEDGGWGWWKTGESDRFMSAYVLWGLSLAREAKVDVRSDVISRAVNYVQLQLVEEENNPDMLAWMLQALAVAHSNSAYEDKQTQRLWDRRDQLNPYTRALFALSEHYRGHKERSEVLARNLINGMKEDKDNQTVHWGEAGLFYRFSEGGVEATALTVKALSNILPQSPELEKAVKWLVLNRRGASWKNTRDTAIVILGLADYLMTTNELTPAYEYDISLNGKSIRSGTVNSQNMFTFDRYLDLADDALLDGRNQIQLKMTGAGAAHLSAHLKYFTKEENIASEGNEVFVKRQYFKTSQKETLLKGYTTDWKVLKAGDQIQSGDRVKVELTLDAKNNYEYLLIEDFKPAGCEAVELKSGEGFAQILDYDDRPSQEKVALYQEFRDQKTAFFISKLKQGKARLSYELRAEVPGEFHGMPSHVEAMYVPEIRANSDEMRVNILDR